MPAAPLLLCFAAHKVSLSVAAAAWCHIRVLPADANSPGRELQLPGGLRRELRSVPLPCRQWIAWDRCRQWGVVVASPSQSSQCLPKSQARVMAPTL
eukprot:COSAG01_NODE_20032_length_975_cov_0.686073_3_plen_97_part_00